MIQLAILSGKSAGASLAARRFPFRLGRGQRMDAQFGEAGVWDDHCELVADPKGITLVSRPGALTHVNGKLVQSQHLRNGDEIEMGALKLRFWIAPTVPRSLAFREVLTWVAVAAMCLSQFVLIYWLLGG